MPTVNMLEAKTQLSKLVEAVESGAEAEIVIARNGKPAARLVPIEQPKFDVSKRIGIAPGAFGDVSPEALAVWDQGWDEKWQTALNQPFMPEGEPSPKGRKSA